MTRARTRARRQPQPKPELPPISEAEVLAQCLGALKALGIPVERRNTGGFTNPSGQYVPFGVPGAADITGTLPDGRRLEIEVKRPGQCPRPEQLEYLRAVNEAGGVGFWLNDARDLIPALDRLKAGWRVEIDDHGRPWLTDEPRKV